MAIVDQTSARSNQLKFDAYATQATAQGTATIAILTDLYSQLTGPAKLLHKSVEDGRRHVRLRDLDNRTADKSRSDAEQLLEELAIDRGLSWSEIARLCEVSVSAVRKWRAGESISPDRRRALARLAAFLELLEDVGPVGEPAGWMNMRLSEHHTVTAADLYLQGRAEDLLEQTQGHLSINDLLDRWDSDWRATTRSEWVVADGPDGQRSLVRRA